MAPLQKINWTQIDSANIPSGSTVNIGSIPTPVDGVFTKVLFIADESGNLRDFFDYLSGFTSGATSNFAVLTGNNEFHGVEHIFGNVEVHSTSGSSIFTNRPIIISGTTSTSQSTLGRGYLVLQGHDDIGEVPSLALISSEPLDFNGLYLTLNASTNEVNPIDAPAISQISPDFNIHTIIGFQPITGWTDGDVTFYVPLHLLSGLTVNGNVDITGQYLINGVPISFGGTNFTVVPNSGLELVSGTTGNTLSTAYNTTLDPLLATPSTVGGIAAGTTVAQLSGKTFVEFVDDLLFPIVLPTYTIPTMNISGVASQTLEIGSTYAPNINAFGDKNDAGSFTQIRVLRNGSVLSGYTGAGLTSSSISSIPNQFGYTDPNNPNFRYTIDPTPYVESFIIPTPGGAAVSTSTTYNSDGNYSSGLPKNNNKGNLDVRSPLVRSVNAPQAAGVNFASSISTITGIFPYFWGTSLTLPTSASIAATIAGGLANKILLDASGNLSIPYNMPSGTYLFIWVAYYGSYTAKTKWFVTVLDSGDIDNTFITTAAPQLVTSPDGYWVSKSYKMHWSINPTTQNGNFIYQP